MSEIDKMVNFGLAKAFGFELKPKMSQQDMEILLALFKASGQTTVSTVENKDGTYTHTVNFVGK
jgi:hypothetical protein